MAKSRVVRIHKTLDARIPAEEARCLGLRPGQGVDLQVRPLPRGADSIMELRGTYRGLFARKDGREMWGD